MCYLTIKLESGIWITENKHFSREPQLSSVTRNCQIYSMHVAGYSIKEVFFFQI